MEIHQDYLQTGTAIGSRASHEHFLFYCCDEIMRQAKTAAKQTFFFILVHANPCDRPTTVPWKYLKNLHKRFYFTVIEQTTLF